MNYSSQTWLSRRLAQWPEVLISAPRMRRTDFRRPSGKKQLQTTVLMWWRMDSYIRWWCLDKFVVTTGSYYCVAKVVCYILYSWRYNLGYVNKAIHAMISEIININTTDVTLGGHAPYGRHHVVPSTVSLACDYTSLVKPVLTSVIRVSLARSHGPAKPAFCCRES